MARGVWAGDHLPPSAKGLCLQLPRQAFQLPGTRDSCFTPNEIKFPLLPHLHLNTGRYWLLFIYGYYLYMCKTSISHSVGYSKNTHLPVHLFCIVTLFFPLFLTPCSGLTVAEDLQINKSVNSPIKADCFTLLQRLSF